jgi:anti-anti-sigma regulatory factor
MTMSVTSAPNPCGAANSGLAGLTATLDPVGRIALEGDLDAAGVDVLRTVLDQALLGSGKIIAIDASRVTSMDPVAVTELLCYHLVALANLRSLRLTAASRPVLDTLDAFDFEPILMAGEGRTAPVTRNGRPADSAPPRHVGGATWI